MIINLNFYKEDINYDKLVSKEIEDYIVKNYIFAKEKEHYKYILEHNISNEALYCLSKKRENIINWYRFKENASILEIGARVGEITGKICENAKRVVAVEFTKQKGEAIGVRHNDKDNLEIIIRKLRRHKFL